MKKVLEGHTLSESLLAVIRDPGLEGGVLHHASGTQVSLVGASTTT